MLRLKKTAYVTIGDVAAAPAAPAAEGVDALACEQESAAIYAATEPLKSLVEVRLAGAARVLVVDAGTTGESIVAGCLAAGLVPCVAYTEDMARAAHVKLAPKTVCVGKSRETGALDDSYRVLSAAESADAQAILLVDSRLAVDERFLSMAADEHRSVYSVPVASINAAFGGITRVWRTCSAPSDAALHVSDDSWVTCPKCRRISDAQRVLANHKMCPECGHHFRMTSAERLASVLDAESFECWFETEDADVPETDPLDFPGYLDKIGGMRKKTGLREGVRCGVGRIAGMRVAIGVMDSTFFMGSMGSVVGERITRLAEHATEEGLPLVLFTCSGGARMQEGLVSLMQMAKISAAIERHGEAGLPYFSVITDPTTGGVTASFAMQGDVIISEPRALIGFAGRRVIQDTIRQELPKEFQTAEFALEHGLIDAIVERPRIRETLANLLALHAKPEAGAPRGFVAVLAALAANPTKCELEAAGAQLAADERDILSGVRAVAVKAAAAVPKRVANGMRSVATRRAYRAEIEQYTSKPGAAKQAEAAENPAWASVQTARDVHRPTAGRYLEATCEGFFECHGDRGFADDAAIVAGIGWVAGEPATLIAQEKGRDLQDRIKRNFGCPQPEGYRKSLRLMRQAERFERAVVCFVDTQGAFCGKEAEERGQGNAIANNLYAMAGLRVPTVSVLVGEGGSGGALALALADRVAMQEHAVYSVLSPEGFASILWKDRSRAAEASAVMRMNAYEIFDMDIVDAVLEEGEGSASANPDFAIANVVAYVEESLDELSALPIDELLEQRYERFRKF